MTFKFFTAKEFTPISPMCICWASRSAAGPTVGLKKKFEHR